MIQIIDINVGRFENLKSMIDIFGYKKQMSENLEFMLLALEKSRQALPLCRPNPPVGCVIVHKQKVVSEGFTQLPGHHHAEIDAISKLLVPIDECEIYVTLEPCSFQGRTPSCALRLAELKPRHVYVAIEDPHPRNSGEGLRILKDAGVSFTLGIGKQEVENFLTPYLVMP